MYKIGPLEFIISNHHYLHLYVFFEYVIALFISAVTNTNFATVSIALEKIIPPLIYSAVLFLYFKIFFRIANEKDMKNRSNVLMLVCIFSFFSIYSFSTWKFLLEFHRNALVILIMLIMIYRYNIFSSNQKNIFKILLENLLFFSIIAFTHFETFALFLVITILFYIFILLVMSHDSSFNMKYILLTVGLPALFPIFLLYVLGFYSVWVSTLPYLVEPPNIYQNLIYYVGYNSQIILMLVFLSIIYFLWKIIAKKEHDIRVNFLVFSHITYLVLSFFLYCLGYCFNLDYFKYLANMNSRLFLLIPSQIYLTYILWDLDLILKNSFLYIQRKVFSIAMMFSLLILSQFMVSVYLSKLFWTQPFVTREDVIRMNEIFSFIKNNCAPNDLVIVLFYEGASAYYYPLYSRELLIFQNLNDMANYNVIPLYSDALTAYSFLRYSQITKPRFSLNMPYEGFFYNDSINNLITLLKNHRYSNAIVVIHPYYYNLKKLNIKDITQSEKYNIFFIVIDLNR
jgi:hypothetical protein